MPKKQLQVTKISTHGRIYLGNVVMERLNARIGDHVQIVQNDDGSFKIAKIEA